jgi:hypothetical protein
MMGKENELFHVHWALLQLDMDYSVAFLYVHSFHQPLCLFASDKNGIIKPSLYAYATSIKNDNSDI